MSKPTIIALLILATCTVYAQPKSSNVLSNPPALNAITEKDLRTDLFELASDHFRGREAAL